MQHSYEVMELTESLPKEAGATALDKASHMTELEMRITAVLQGARTIDGHLCKYSVGRKWRTAKSSSIKGSIS